jgi:predicted deacylase
MAARLAPRSQRVGGVDVAPGRSTFVQLGRLVRNGSSGSSLSAWVGVGNGAGPRVSVVAAVHGYEVAATLAARALVREIDPASLQGTLVIVPVFRPGDRFSKGGQRAPSLNFPGDAGGPRLQRLAFSLHADVVVNADLVILLGAPRPGRRGLLVAEAPLDDARSKKLAQAAGAQVILPARSTRGGLLAASAAAGRVVVRLSAGGAEAGPEADAAVLLAAVRRALAVLGAFPHPSLPEPPMAARTCLGRDLVRAPAGGVLEELLPVGSAVGQGDVLARLAPPVPGESQAVLAPVPGIVLESPSSVAVRKGAVLFTIGRLSPEEGKAGARVGPRAVMQRVGPDPSSKLRAGWLERVSLPDLGIAGVPAKIDTGARTSALHVMSSKVVGNAAGPSRRPILEITLATGGSSRRRQVVRAPVREFIEVRDTSGRLERRPVIETTLELGPLRRRIRITLTDRGDMRCPMLVGRTALGASVVVDPSARNLLGGERTRAPIKDSE